MSKLTRTMGSYPQDYVTFLLKDLSHLSIEKTTGEREKAIQSGTHYSEMLPIEYEPTREYLQLFYDFLEEYKQKVALAVGVVAEQIVEKRGFQTVLCSLARAGTPIGVLIKKYIEFKYNQSLPHYSISIIRGRGIDENALQYIENNHQNESITFIDGWTGKGAITKELTQSIENYNQKYTTHHSSELAVLADPGYCSTLYGTREDMIIPSACLNSTVSGLVSRSVLNDKWIHSGDFHGAKYYSELHEKDLSNFYIDTITAEFEAVEGQVDDSVLQVKETYEEPNWEGLLSIQRIQKEFEIEDINLIKPGVGETTRVLLRRVPWKILIQPGTRDQLQHILLLAEDRNVPIEEYSNMSYSCCGLIRPVGDKK